MKKIIAVVLCIILCISMVACSSSKKDEPNDKVDMSTTTPQQFIPDDSLHDGPNQLPDVSDGNENGDGNKFEPELLTMLGQVQLGNKVVDVNKLTKKDLTNVGYKFPTISIWTIANEYFSIGGTSASKDSIKVKLGFKDDNSTITIVGTDDPNSGIYFYNQIQMSTPIDEIREKMYGFEIEECVEDEDNQYYMFHDAKNTLLVIVEEGSVSGIYLCISKECDMNLTEAEKEAKREKEILESFAQNDTKNWDGHSHEINYSFDVANVDIAKVKLDDNVFTFTKLTKQELSYMGYKFNGKMKLLENGDDGHGVLYHTVEMLNSAGAEISCIYNESGAIEFLDIRTIAKEGDFLYEEDAVQANYELFGCITPGMSQEDFENALRSVGVQEINDDKTIVKTDKMTIVFTCSDGRLSRVKLINSGLVW